MKESILKPLVSNRIGWILVRPQCRRLFIAVPKTWKKTIFTESALWVDAFYKSNCPSVCLSVCPSVCLSVRVFTFEVPFERLFAPISRSRMSNIFRDLESLGKSNGKKWSQIGTFLFGSGLKLRRKKKFFLADFALQNMVETTLSDGLATSGRRAYR